MKQKTRRKFARAAGMLAAFVLWTALVCVVDVREIGPQGSTVGFAALNRYFHNLTGVHLSLYTLTDWLSLLPFVVMLGFGTLGLGQWICRRQLRTVDRSLLVLGGFYLTVLAVYLLFEKLSVNCRPVLINGVLEASYPSSTTVLVLCVMPTAVLQMKTRLKNPRLRQIISAAMTAFALLMVVGRLLSGVHWLSDIVGGVLLSGGLVLLYDALVQTQ